MFRYTAFDASPWRLLDEMMDVDSRLNRALKATAERATGRYPRVNIFTSDNGAIVEAALPGTDPSTVEVSVEDQVLEIKGRRPDGKDSDQPFERRFELPFAVAEEGVNAKYSNGMLSINLPRAPQRKPHKIAVAKG